MKRLTQLALALMLAGTLAVPGCAKQTPGANGPGGYALDDLTRPAEPVPDGFVPDPPDYGLLSSADLQALAEKGDDLEAQYALASRYYLRHYTAEQKVSEDWIEAVRWFRKVATYGSANAQYLLGILYRDSKDGYNEAVSWFRQAAEQGHEAAQFELGLCYHQGHGVAKNDVEAVRWYRKSATQNNVSAQCNLSLLYREGHGVPKDDVESAKWLRKAAEQGDASAEFNLGVCYYYGHGVLKNQTEAVKWWRKAAEQGDAPAENNLGLCYENGQGVPQNDIEAYAWFSLAAAHQVEGAATLRDLVSQRMARAEVVEAQRRAAAFVARTESGGTGSDKFPPKPEVGEATRFRGTGFFITDDGYLVTCEHVVRGATSFLVKSAAGSVPAKLVSKDRTLDVAVLKVNGTFRALPLASEPRVKLGDAVFTVGFPNPDVQGVEPKLTRGEISSLAGIHDDARCFQISVPVQPGNSGGALLDETGSVVGVVTSRLDDLATYEISGALPQNVNYAVKSTLVHDFLKRVPGLSAKLKAPRKSIDREAANVEAERAAVLVIAE